MTNMLPNECILVVNKYSLNYIQEYLHNLGYSWVSGKSLLNVFYKETISFIIHYNKVRYSDESIRNSMKAHPTYKVIYDYELLDCKNLFND